MIHHLGGFKLLLANTSKDDGFVVYRSNASDVDVVYSILLHGALARFVTVGRLSILTICEVIILEGGMIFI